MDSLEFAGGWHSPVAANKGILQPPLSQDNEHDWQIGWQKSQGWRHRFLRPEQPYLLPLDQQQGAIFGLTDAGLNISLLRLAANAAHHGWKVVFFDAQGSPDLATRFVSTMHRYSRANTYVFPNEPYNGFEGNRSALFHCLLQITPAQEPYYQRIAVLCLSALLQTQPIPPQNMDALVGQLINKVHIDVIAPNGMRATIPLRLNAKRVQLLAYIAWLRGEKTNRDKMVEAVFGHGLSDEEATPKRLADAFDSHRKFLRRDLRSTVARPNTEAGSEVIPADLDFFSITQKLWGLAPHCQIIDLEIIEAQHQIIETAHRNGQLINEVPEAVKQACDTLLQAYMGTHYHRFILMIALYYKKNNSASTTHKVTTWGSVGVERREDSDVLSKMIQTIDHNTQERFLKQAQHRTSSLTLRLPEAIVTPVSFFEHCTTNP